MTLEEQLVHLDEIAQVEHLSFKQGDVIVLKVPVFLNRCDVDYLTERVRAILQDPTVKVLVLDGGMDIAVGDR